MKKIIYLIAILIIILGAVIIFRPPANNQNLIPKESLSCKTDSDCQPFISECGYCTDYDIAINKDYYPQYLQQYQSKCKINVRTCDAIPRGESICQNNTCALK